MSPGRCRRSCTAAAPRTACTTPSSTSRAATAPSCTIASWGEGQGARALGDPARDSRTVPAGPTARVTRGRARVDPASRDVLGVEPRVDLPRPVGRSRGTALGQIVAIPFDADAPSPRDPPRVPLLPLADLLRGHAPHGSWFERPVTYDVRARAHQVTSNSGSRDLPMVNISLGVLTPRRPSSPRYTAPSARTSTSASSPASSTRRSSPSSPSTTPRSSSPSASRPAVRATLVKRGALQHDPRRRLHHRAHLRARIPAAIEAKQVAQEEAERAKFIVEKAVQDKRSAVIKAEGGESASSSAKPSRPTRRSSPFVASRRRGTSRRPCRATTASCSTRTRSCSTSRRSGRARRSERVRGGHEGGAARVVPEFARRARPRPPRGYAPTDRDRVCE